MMLQEMVLEALKESLKPTPGHTAAETVGTSLLDDELEETLPQIPTDSHDLT